MDKRVVIIGVVVAVLATLGYVLYGTSGNNESKDTLANTNQFDPVSVEGIPFEAVQTSSSKPDYKMIMKSDGKGNTVSETASGETKMTFYNFKGDYISCASGAKCMRLGAAGKTASQSDVVYDQSKLDEFKKLAKSKGEANCGDQKCSVWSVDTKTFKGDFYLDSNRHFAKIIGTAGQDKWQIDYTYKPVTIERPTDVIDLAAQK